MKKASDQSIVQLQVSSVSVAAVSIIQGDQHPMTPVRFVLLDFTSGALRYFARELQKAVPMDTAACFRRNSYLPNGAEALDTSRTAFEAGAPAGSRNYAKML